MDKIQIVLQKVVAALAMFTENNTLFRRANAWYLGGIQKVVDTFFGSMALALFKAKQQYGSDPASIKAVLDNGQELLANASKLWNSVQLAAPAYKPILDELLKAVEEKGKEMDLEWKPLAAEFAEVAKKFGFEPKGNKAKEFERKPYGTDPRGYAVVIGIHSAVIALAMCNDLNIGRGEYDHDPSLHVFKEDSTFSIYKPWYGSEVEYFEGAEVADAAEHGRFPLGKVGFLELVEANEVEGIPGSYDSKWIWAFFPAPLPEEAE